MPCMPDIISKGVILSKLDEVLNDPPRRDKLYERLIIWRDNIGNRNRASELQFENLGRDIPAGLQYNILTWGERVHMRSHWFTEWWTDAQTKSPTGANGVEHVLGLGIIQLIEIAREQCCSKVIDCYWACAAQHDHSCAHPQGLGVTTLPAAARPHERIIDEVTRTAVAGMERQYGEQESPRPRTPRRNREPPAVPCSTEERVDCSITWSRAQITFTIHTPPPGNGYEWDAQRMRVPEPIAVVRWDVDESSIITNYPGRSAYSVYDYLEY